MGATVRPRDTAARRPALAARGYVLSVSESAQPATRRPLLGALGSASLLPPLTPCLPEVIAPSYYPRKLLI
jgi:hypothetical protein